MGRAVKTKAKRRPYRADVSAKLAAIERRRVAAGITIQELALRAGIPLRTFVRGRTDGQMFERHVVALTRALRELEKEKGRERQWGLDQ